MTDCDCRTRDGVHAIDCALVQERLRVDAALQQYEVDTYWWEYL